MSDEYTLELFFESWEYFEMAALSGVFAGVVLGFLGVYIVLRRMVFLSAALSQASGLGVAYAFYVQVTWGAQAMAHSHALANGAAPDVHPFIALVSSPLVMATFAALVVTGVLALGRSIPTARRESLLGLAYLVGAAGTLVIGTRIVEEVQDIQSILFGNAVVVTAEDYAQVKWLAISLLALHLVWMRGFMQASFDPEGAKVRGLPVRMLDLMLLASLAVAVSMTTRVLGALPVFAFSVLPAMAAVRLSPNVRVALVGGAVIGGVSGFAGYLAAFLYEVPVGAAQTMVAASFVGIAEALYRVRWLVAWVRVRRRIPA